VIRMLGELDRLATELEATDSTIDQLTGLHGALGNRRHAQGRLGRVVEQHTAAVQYAAQGLAHLQRTQMERPDQRIERPASQLEVLDGSRLILVVPPDQEYATGWIT